MHIEQATSHLGGNGPELQKRTCMQWGRQSVAIRGNHQVRAPIGEANQWPSEAIIRSELQLGTILDSRHEAELDVSGAGTRFVS